jgi:hypothetical protein
MSEQGVRVLGEDTVEIKVESGRLKGHTLHVATLKRSERIKLMRAVGGNLDSDVTKMEFATLVMRRAVRRIDPHPQGVNVHSSDFSDESRVGLSLLSEDVADLLDDETLAKVVAAAMEQHTSEAGN